MVIFSLLLRFGTRGRGRWEGREGGTGEEKKGGGRREKDRRNLFHFRILERGRRENRKRRWGEKEGKGKIIEGKLTFLLGY